MPASRVREPLGDPQPARGPTPTVARPVRHLDRRRRQPAASGCCASLPAATARAYRCRRRHARRDRRSGVHPAPSRSSTPQRRPRRPLPGRPPRPLAGGRRHGRRPAAQRLQRAQYPAPLTALGRPPGPRRRLRPRGARRQRGLRVRRPRRSTTSPALAEEGAVLSVSWHPDNPGTRRGRTTTAAGTTSSSLLDDHPGRARAFWADFDAGMRAPPAAPGRRGVAVVFRPFHEANGGWFWWGHPDPDDVPQALGRRCSSAPPASASTTSSGPTASTPSPAATSATRSSCSPAQVDLAGMDCYSRPGEPLRTAGYAAVAAKVARMAITEAGPDEQLRRLLEPRRRRAAPRAPWPTRRSGRCSGSTTAAARSS